MTPYKFGYMLGEKLAADPMPGLPKPSPGLGAPPAQTPTPSPTTSLANPSQAPAPQLSTTGAAPVPNKPDPLYVHPLADYSYYANKPLNAPANDNTELALRYGQRIASGIGTAAGTGAAILTGAPAVAAGVRAMPGVMSSASNMLGRQAVTGIGQRAIAGAGAAGTFLANQAQRGGAAVNNAIAGINQFGNNAYARIADTGNNLLARAANSIPAPMQQAAHAYEHYIGKPTEMAAESMGAGTIGNPLSGVTQLASGNIMGAVPHSFTFPAETLKSMGEAGEHALGAYGGELAHAGMAH